MMEMNELSNLISWQLVKISKLEYHRIREELYFFALVTFPIFFFLLQDNKASLRQTAGHNNENLVRYISREGDMYLVLLIRLK